MSTPPLTTCPGCGLQLAATGASIDERFNASGECLALYHELSAYTLNKGDDEYINEVVVDTYRAQHIAGGKKMTAFFALSGLYLYLEQGYTGRQARQAHVDMARHKDFDWPVFNTYDQKFHITIADVIAAEAGRARDVMIQRWAESTWQAWYKERERVMAVCRQVL